MNKKLLVLNYTLSLYVSCNNSGSGNNYDLCDNLYVYNMMFLVEIRPKHSSAFEIRKNLNETPGKISSSRL